MQARQEIRCPSCARPLVLRSGPAITPHYAHRPRQSCRRRPGRVVSPLHLEQLTLFELEAGPVPDAPVAKSEAWSWEPTVVPPVPRPARRRRRRRAWLPRLIRWLKGQSR